jgi:cation transport regulator ChaC
MGVFFPKSVAVDDLYLASNEESTELFVKSNGIPVHMYVAPGEGPLFLGPANAQATAEQIVSRSGPSGHNLEYFRKLLKFLQTECPPGSVDEHMEEIDRAIGVLIRAD